MKESWHTYEGVVVHILTGFLRHTLHAVAQEDTWMSFGTHMKQSWHTYEGVMAHI